MKDIKYKSSEYSHTPRWKESKSTMAARELSYHALDLVSSKTETRHGSEGGSKGAGSYNPGVCETLP